jgi:hypothetical protein
MEEKLREREKEAQKLQKDVNDSFLKKLDVDLSAVESWMPWEINLSWSGWNLNTASISRQILKTQRDNMVIAREDRITHFRRSIRLDIDRTLLSVQWTRRAQRSHIQIENILRSQGMINLNLYLYTYS